MRDRYRGDKSLPFPEQLWVSTLSWLQSGVSYWFLASLVVETEVCSLCSLFCKKENPSRAGEAGLGVGFCF